MDVAAEVQGQGKVEGRLRRLVRPAAAGRTHISRHGARENEVGHPVARSQEDGAQECDDPAVDGV